MGASASTIAEQTAGQLYSSLADSGAFPLLLEVHSSSNGSSHEGRIKNIGSKQFVVSLGKELP